MIGYNYYLDITIICHAIIFQYIKLYKQIFSFSFIILQQRRQQRIADKMVAQFHTSTNLRVSMPALVVIVTVRLL